jgi:hypothetical protein
VLANYFALTSFFTYGNREKEINKNRRRERERERQREMVGG